MSKHKPISGRECPKNPPKAPLPRTKARGLTGAFSDRRIFRTPKKIIHALKGGAIFFERIKILCNKFGFSVARQKGSHIVLRKETQDGSVGTVVPNHKEIKPGTLKGVLELARVDEEEFLKYV